MAKAAKKKDKKKDEPKTDNAPVDNNPVAENEQLATKGPTALQTELAPPPMGYDGFTEDDLVVPRVSIVQKAGDAVDKGHTLGFLMSNISDEEWETITATGILYKKGMVCFEKPYRAGATPICRSNDAMTPSPEVEDPPSKVCHRIVRRRLQPICPKAQWNKDEKTGRSIPPECNLCYNVIWTRDDTGMPFFMSFRSSGIAPFKNLITPMWGMKQNLFHVKVEISTEDKTNAYGTFKIPKFKVLESHTPEEEAELVEVYKGMQQMDLDASFDDERNLADDGEAMDEGDTSFDTSELEGDKF